MSRATGEVWVSGELKGHFVYDGITDTAFQRIYENKADFDAIRLGRTATSANKEHSMLMAFCDCQPTVFTPAVIYNNYGDGSYWDGAVCLKCGAITGGMWPWHDNLEIKDGHPYKEDD